METQREELQEHLRSEVKHNMMEPQFSDIEEWVTKGLPTAFTSNVFQRIIMHFQADQIYVLSQINQFSLGPNEEGSKRECDGSRGAGVLARGTRSCT